MLEAPRIQVSPSRNWVLRKDVPDLLADRWDFVLENTVPGAQWFELRWFTKVANYDPSTSHTPNSDYFQWVHDLLDWKGIRAEIVAAEKNEFSLENPNEDSYTPQGLVLLPGAAMPVYGNKEAVLTDRVTRVGAFKDVWQINDPSGVVTGVMVRAGTKRNGQNEFSEWSEVQVMGEHPTSTFTGGGFVLGETTRDGKKVELFEGPFWLKRLYEAETDQGVNALTLDYETPWGTLQSWVAPKREAFKKLVIGNTNKDASESVDIPVN